MEPNTDTNLGNENGIFYLPLLDFLLDSEMFGGFPMSAMSMEEVNYISIKMYSRKVTQQLLLHNIVCPGYSRFRLFYSK